MDIVKAEIKNDQWKRERDPENDNTRKTKREMEVIEIDRHFDSTKSVNLDHGGGGGGAVLKDFFYDNPRFKSY